MPSPWLSWLLRRGNRYNSREERKGAPIGGAPLVFARAGVYDIFLPKVPIFHFTWYSLMVGLVPVGFAEGNSSGPGRNATRLPYQVAGPPTRLPRLLRSVNRMVGLVLPRQAPERSEDDG